MLLVHLIEAPSNLGLQAAPSGVVPAVNQLPAWLKRWGLYEVLAPKDVYTVLPPPYAGEVDPASGVRNADAIGTYSQHLAACITQVVGQGAFALVLGGDCSIMLGVGLGLRKLGPYGLFFLDGHTDYAWPGLSATGGAAGMDLALVTGRGPAKLTNLDGQQPYFCPEHAWSVGNRDTDAAYVAAITASAVQYVDLGALRQQGSQACAQAFLDDMEARQLAGFWIHFDVDVLDQELMPAVDSPQPGGLTYAELAGLLIPLLQSPKVVGLDITILDPSLDPTGDITRQFVAGLQPIFAALASS